MRARLRLRWASFVSSHRTFSSFSFFPFSSARFHRCRHARSQAVRCAGTPEGSAQKAALTPTLQRFIGRARELKQVTTQNPAELHTCALLSYPFCRLTLLQPPSSHDVTFRGTGFEGCI